MPGLKFKNCTIPKAQKKSEFDRRRRHGAHRHTRAGPPRRSLFCGMFQVKRWGEAKASKPKPIVPLGKKSSGGDDQQAKNPNFSGTKRARAAAQPDAGTEELGAEWKGTKIVFNEDGTTTTTRPPVKEDQPAGESGPGEADDSSSSDKGATNSTPGAESALAALSPRPSKRRRAVKEEDITVANIDLAGDPVPASKAGLRPSLVGALKAAGFDQLFPMQAALVPVAIRCRARHDICVSAPTGSGKTLAYALPVLNALAGRAVPRLRALVVAPTRDLALQVRGVFRRLAKPLGLWVEGCIGQRPFYAEQAVLTGSGLTGSGSGSRVDILVATPGRLVDHLNETHGFSLEHLEFLVVDEADRLLSQSYQGWVPKVLASAHRGDADAMGGGPSLASVGTYRSLQRVFSVRECCPTAAGGTATGVPQLQTMLFSATLTREPDKLEQLALRNPVFFSATDQTRMRQFRTPEGLEERLIVCAAADKALTLLRLLLDLEADGAKQVVVFAGSLETTHRAYRLLEASGSLQGTLAEFSSALPQRRRNAVVRSFKNGDVRTIICSDAMSRGMDIAGVDVVVNYDAPTHIRTYIHRVGRTARAGRSGRAFTLVEPGRVNRFKAMLRRAQNGYVAPYKLDEKSRDELVPQFRKGLEKLRDVLEREASGSQDPSRPVEKEDQGAEEEQGAGDEDDASTQGQNAAQRADDTAASTRQLSWPTRLISLEEAKAKLMCGAQ